MFGGPVAAPNVGRKIWKIGPVLDQRETSACVGFAWTQLLMSEPHPHVKVGFDFARQVYLDAQKRDEWAGEEPEYYGTTTEAGHAVLLTRGLVQKDLYWATTTGQIVQHVISIGPVVMGTEWMSGMMRPDDQGYVRPTGFSEGGHAYLVYGAAAKQQEFWLVNSWGSSFGLSGKFKMSFDSMRKLLDRGGYGVSCLEEAK